MSYLDTQLILYLGKPGLPYRTKTSMLLILLKYKSDHVTSMPQTLWWLSAVLALASLALCDHVPIPCLFDCISITAYSAPFLLGPLCSSHRGLLAGPQTWPGFMSSSVWKTLALQNHTSFKALFRCYLFIIKSTKTTLLKFINCASCPFPQPHLPSSNITLFGGMLG